MASKQIDRQNKRFRREQIHHGGVVSLDDEENEFFDRNGEECWAEDGVVGICPDLGANEIGVPWDGGDDGDLSVAIIACVNSSCCFCLLAGCRCLLTVIKNKALYTSAARANGRYKILIKIAGGKVY